MKRQAERESNRIVELPSDVILQILGECGSPQELIGMSLVCHEWNIQISKLMRMLSLNLLRTNKKRENAEFSKFPRLKVLCLREAPTPVVFMKSKLVNVVDRIEILSLSRKFSNKWFTFQLNNFINLTGLHLKGNIRLYDFLSLSDIASKLRILSLENVFITSFNGLDKLTNLEILALSNTRAPFTDHNLTIAPSFDIAMEQLTKLKSLSLGSWFTNCTYLDKLSQLEYLDIIHTYITNMAFFTNLVRGLEQSLLLLTQLKHLSLPKWTRGRIVLPQMVNLSSLSTYHVVPIQNLLNLKYYQFGYNNNSDKILFLPPDSLETLTVSFRDDIHQASDVEYVIAFIRKKYPTLHITSSMPEKYSNEFFHYLLQSFHSYTEKELRMFRMNHLFTNTVY